MKENSIRYFKKYDDKIYNEKLNEKLKLIDSLKLKTILIYPNDINNLDGVFSMLK